MRLVFVIFIWISISGCQKRIEVCDWQNYLKAINSSEEEISIHASENWFKPNLSKEAPGKGAKIMLQDFRQIEFVSAEYSDLVEKDLEAIRRYKAQFSMKGDYKNFFQKTYIRKNIPHPIRTNIHIEQLAKYFETNLHTKPLLLINCEHRLIENGFSIKLNGIPFYGLTDEEGFIKVLGLYTLDSKHHSDSFRETLAAFMEANNLLLISYNDEFKTSYSNF